MHEELHPLRGSKPLRTSRAIVCRFKHGKHDIEARVYPDSWCYEVRWRGLPSGAEMTALQLTTPSVRFFQAGFWYTVHAIEGDEFMPTWERRGPDGWTPMTHLSRPATPEPLSEELQG